MDGRTRYNKITKMLNGREGETMPLAKLRRMVMIDIGSSDATVEETIRFMMDLGLIKETEAWQFTVVNSEADI